MILVARWIRLRMTGLFARALGVTPDRKVQLFLDLSRAATLKDLVYWLQIFFSAGIATLGLVLNSPAVIIGAMLISPLMNPIFASGLALASGDLVLAVRASANLLLSCVAAIAFATLLVVVLPFREMTPEIVARTQPNVLDLLIALFSGAVGSVAVCREVKGVVTSIPGVAIAVALMPPLSVVGYGVGLMLVFDASTGWRVASGGGLLFLTNLVAIILTGMLVFLALRIDTREVRADVEDWEQSDSESVFVINSLKKIPGLEKARKIHSIPLRLAMILLPMALILVPLSSAFNQLRTEIAAKQRESHVRSVVTEVWQQRFQNDGEGSSRSSVDKLEVTEKDGYVDIRLRVFDDTPYTLTEKKECARLIAQRLGRPAESVHLRLTEIPTVSVIESLRESRDEAREMDLKSPTLNGRDAAEQFDAAVSGIAFPSGAEILRREIAGGGSYPLSVRIIYLSETRFDKETESAIIDEISKKLRAADVRVTFGFVPATVGNIIFGNAGGELPVSSQLRLDLVGRLMNENPPLGLTVSLPPLTGGAPPELDRRYTEILTYLGDRWQIDTGRIKLVASEDGDRNVMLRFVSEVDGDGGTPNPVQ